MTDYPPPQYPYGQQPPPYGQQPYGQPPYGQPAYGAPAGGYASWLQRVGAYLIDGLVFLAAYLPILVGDVLITGASDSGGVSAVGIVLVLVGAVASIAVFVWNICLRGGRTGYTIGKGALGIRLVSESTGQPIGAGMAFVRQVAHIVDSIPCYLGYLWPLWDGKRQTFADKLLKTIVVNQPQA